MSSRETAQQILHEQAGAESAELGGINVVLSYPSAARSELWLSDVSHLSRAGLKGPNAAAWLEQAGIALPERPNTWSPLDQSSATDDWSVVARLGTSEFLLEQDGGGDLIRRLSDLLARDSKGVYPVLREDSEFVIGGAQAALVLAEVCNIDFARIAGKQRLAIMTLMAGVAVLVIPQFEGSARRYRIWCDPSFGAYLWNTLTNVIADHSGAVLGMRQLAAAPRLPPATERHALGEDS
jgi:sarcosine oxidase, subunit gamma